MTSFGLLTVLGNGSGRIATHHRFSVAAYQSGALLVLWDYGRTRGEVRKFVVLEPNQRCQRLVFSRDARSLLGFWLSQSGQPTLTVWRVTDGAKAAEHRLSDTVANSPLLVDFHTETSYLVFAHGGPPWSATVMLWDIDGLKPRFICHGPLGSVEHVLSVSLLDDGRHFVLGGAGAVQFWSFAEQSPRLALRVDFQRPVREVQVWDHLVYLLTQRGSLQLMNFEGQRSQRSIAPPVGATFTAVAVRSNAICLGSDQGELLVYDTSTLELRTHVPAPPELGQTVFADACPQAVAFLSLGTNEDYACVCFADATHGAVHLPSARYVALRVGHAAAVRCLAMAPRLELPSGLGGRLLDQERVLISRALAFVSVSGERTFISWPQRGPPARTALRRPEEWPRTVTAGEDDGAVLECWGPSLLRSGGAGVQMGFAVASPAEKDVAITVAAFHPRACLSHDGHLSGAYQLLAGAEDGSLHLLESDDGSGAAGCGLAWRAVRRRVPPPELGGEAGRLLGGSSIGAVASCCHLAFSRCGRFVVACLQGGRTDLLHFPSMGRALVLEGRTGAAGEPGGSSGGGPLRVKALFVWRPTDAERKYDQNIYVLSHTASPSELVLYEVYLLGNAYAKSSLLLFALPAICLAAGGTITDFCVHPSQQFLLVAAALPAAETRAVLLVFNLWSGELLKSCALFASLLVTPLQPLRPSVCSDASGAFVFCTSSPLMVGSLDQNFVQPPFGDRTDCGLLDQRSGHGVVSDSLIEGSPTVGAVAARPETCSKGIEPRASVVCIIDFASGQQIYQCSMEAGCLSLGSLARNPLQLLAGASDGSLSMWRPPESVVATALALLEDCKREFLARDGKERDIIEHFSAEDLEEAVALHWASNLAQLVDWARWGEQHAALRPQCNALSGGSGGGLREGPRQTLRMPEQEEEDDVVVQARRVWPLPGAVAGAARVGERGGVAVPLERAAPTTVPWMPNIGGGIVDGHLGADEPRIPLHASRASPPPAAGPPPPWARQGSSSAARSSGAVAPVMSPNLLQQHIPDFASNRVLEPAELLGPAPELREEFGTMAEHSEDPLPSAPLSGDSVCASVPRWLERGRPLLPAETGTQEAIAQSVFAELGHFEAANLPSNGPEGGADDDSD